MLTSCKYCGRIHQKNYDCGKKPVRKKKPYTKMNRFRSTEAWKRKSVEIRQRDNYLCQICIRKLYNTIRQYNYDNLSVHHAIPITDDWDKRLDDDNLITGCSMHHEMMEDGTIPYEEIKKIIDEQEEKRLPRGIVAEIF